MGYFWGFLFVHVIFWVLVPYFSRQTMHYDSSEAFAWGLTWEWGTNKHPPLSGWLLEGLFYLLGSPDLAVYLLGALCSALALVFIRCLALGFLDSGSAFLSTIFLEGIIYYNFCITEYNVNVLSMALVPVMVYGCWRAIQTKQIFFWLLAGLFGGMALLTKYTNALFIAALAAYLVGTPVGRSCLKTPGPWLAALIAALIFLPHLIWLAHYDFLPLHYSHGKTTTTLTAGGRILEPLRLLLAQGVNAIAALGLWVLFYLKTPSPRPDCRWPDAFLFCAGVLPLFFLLMLVAFLGIQGSTKWAYAFIGYVPLLLFYCFPVVLSKNRQRQALFLTYIVLLLFGVGILLKNLAFTAATTHVNSRELAATLKEAWVKETGQPLYYVGGETHLVSRVSTYLPERPRPLWFLNSNITPWEDQAKIKSAGVLVLAFSEAEYVNFMSRHPSLSSPLRLDFPFRAPLGREKTLNVYYGFLKPGHSWEQ